MTFSQVPNYDIRKSLSEQINASDLKEAPVSLSALEGPIDPEKYRLGAGDALEFKVWGKIEITHTLKVAPDGFVAIPNVGSFELAGKTISDATGFISEKARERFPNGVIELRLLAVRKMKVVVSGSVNFPGVYDLLAVDRLSKLISEAGGFIDLETTKESKDSQRQKARDEKSKEEDEKSKEHKNIKPSVRRIKITDREGRTRHVDFLTYLNTGNIECNPILKDGDKVHVSVTDVEVNNLSVFGEVKLPGKYEYVEGDSLLDLINIAGGFKESALISDISILRFSGEDGDYEREIKVNYYDYIGHSKGPRLEPDDRIFVRKIPDFRNKYHVEVIGEVLYPGIYPITQDSTRLTDIIADCGGFTDRANLRSAKVIRKSIAEVDDPEFERLSKMNVAEMREMEYEYYKTRLREEEPNVVVDFHKLFVESEESEDIILRSKDEISIPVQFPTVNVTGQVNRPGLIRWIPGKNVEYYIERAGGFSWNAEKGKLRLIKAQTGMWIKPKNKTQVEIGDTIFVPEKQEIDYWELWKDIMLVVSQVATVILVIRTVS